MKHELNFFPELLLRAPYYPVQTYTRERLRQALDEPEFRNALWLASPQFYQSLEEKNFEYPALSARQQFTLQKYFNRMCFRPTPFGGFATFSLLPWGDAPGIQLAGQDGTWLHLLPDQQLRSQWAAATELDAAEPLFLNSYLHLLPHRQYRFLQSQADESGGRYQFTLAALPEAPLYREMFRRLRQGPMTAGELQDWMSYRTGCAADEAWTQLLYLTEAQVLWRHRPDMLLHPDGGGDEQPFKDEASGEWNYWRRRSVDQAGLLAKAARHLIPPAANRLPGGPSATQPFYGACERHVLSGELPVRYQTDLRNAVEALRRLVPASLPADLAAFMTAFQQRFDRQRIPLLEAFDPDLGLPYAHLNFAPSAPNELSDLRFPVPPIADAPLRWTPVHQLLLQRWLQEPSRRLYDPLLLTAADVQSLPADPTPLPPTSALLFRMTAGQLHLESAGGASATALAGRFSAFSGAVANVCQALAAHEAGLHPELAFADLHVLTDTHVDNVNRRQAMYDYEIPINVMSALPLSQQLPLDDLVLSLQDGEFILESRRLQMRVIPRLPSAYNYTRSELPAFRFLCDLQHQGLHTALSLHLEDYFPGLSFYPRVVYQRCILAPAQWILKAQQVAALLNAGNESLPKQVHAFRQQHGLPEQVCLGTADQQLVFNLTIPDEMRFWITCLKGRSTIHLKEYLPPDETVTVGGQTLAAQFLAFTLCAERVYQSAPRLPDFQENKVQRHFPLGSSWLYLKLFCTPATADLLLLNVIRPFFRMNRAKVNSWFFIRYTEEGDHLRLRLQVENKHLGTVLTGMHAYLRRKGYDRMLQDYQGNTYEREIERYSPALIGQAEELFHQGSELVLWWLNYEPQTTLTRLNLALMITNYWVCQLLPAEEQLIFYSHMEKAFLKEANADTALKADLNQKYRLVAAQLTNILSLKNWPRRLFRLLRLQQPTLQQIRNVLTSRTVTARRQWVADVIHMQLNRIFNQQQRRCELQVYVLLHKYQRALTYRSRRAKQ